MNKDHVHSTTHNSNNDNDSSSVCRCRSISLGIAKPTLASGCDLFLLLGEALLLVDVRTGVSTSDKDVIIELLYNYKLMIVIH